MFDSMASHRENSQVHQESAPRAPVVPQHATGMRNNNGNEQRGVCGEGGGRENHQYSI